MISWSPSTFVSISGMILSSVSMLTAWVWLCVNTTRPTPFNFMVLNLESCLFSAITFPEPFNVSFPHPLRSTTIQPDKNIDANSEMINNGIHLIFIISPLVLPCVPADFTADQQGQGRKNFSWMRSTLNLARGVPVGWWGKKIPDPFRLNHTPTFIVYQIRANARRSMDEEEDQFCACRF